VILLALALQTAAPPPANPVAEEIVVIGEKMKAWRAAIHFGKKGTECTIKVSTGDAAIDGIGCSAMEQCWPEFHARFEATRAKGVTASDRKTRMAALNQELGTCVMARRDAAIAELADARVAARINP
jgi:hypothetical protein